MIGTFQMTAKRNIVNKVLKAWYELLNENISVPVYRVDAPPEEDGNYVIIRAESETDVSNNQSNVHAPVIITEIVTRHRIRIDDSVAPGIDDEICVLLFSRPGLNNLPVQDEIQISGVKRLNATYLSEDDGVNRCHRLITRNIHRVTQLELST